MSSRIDVCCPNRTKNRETKPLPAPPRARNRRSPRRLRRVPHPANRKPASGPRRCSRRSGGFHLSRKAVRAAGTIVLKSTYHGNMEVDFSSLVVDEITLIGSRCGPFVAALQLLGGIHQVPPEPSFSRNYYLQPGACRYLQPLGAFVVLAIQGVFQSLLGLDKRPGCHPLVHLPGAHLLAQVNLGQRNG